MRLRPLLIPLSGLILVLSALLAFGGLNDSLVYYLTPAEASEQRAEFADGRRFRLAGDVAADSINEFDNAVAFTAIGDGGEVAVLHVGAPPQLFQPGIPVVVEGAWDGDVFRSDTMLIHHDEEYYPEGSDQRPDGHGQESPSQPRPVAETAGRHGGSDDAVARR